MVVAVVDYGAVVAELDFVVDLVLVVEVLLVVLVHAWSLNRSVVQRHLPTLADSKTVQSVWVRADVLCESDH